MTAVAWDYQTTSAENSLLHVHSSPLHIAQQLAERHTFDKRRKPTLDALLCQYPIRIPEPVANLYEILHGLRHSLHRRKPPARKSCGQCVDSLFQHGLFLCRGRESKSAVRKKARTAKPTQHDLT